MAPKMQHPQSTSSIPQVDSITRRQSFFSSFKVAHARPEQIIDGQAPEAIAVSEQSSNERPSSRKSLKRALSSQMSRVSSVLLGQSSPTCESPLELPMAAEVTTPPPSATQESSTDVDVGGPRFQTSHEVEPIGERTAGDPAVYSNIAVCYFLNAGF